MRKWIAMMLALVLVLGLTACGGKEANVDEPVITRPAEVETQPQVQEEAAPAPVETEAAVEAAATGNYTFLTDGVELIPSDPFDPSILPEAESVYEVPSCAIEGTDNLYNYGTFELTAFDDGTHELIYSILFIDPNITTTEGLALGDNMDKVVELYGEGYTQEGNALVYTGDAELLYIIMQGESVASIEYRMIVE